LLSKIYLFETHRIDEVLYVLISIDDTFDNNCVGHDPSTIDVAPVSAAADAQRAADVPHPAPVARVVRQLRRNSQGSRCLSKRKIIHVSFATHDKRI
jgi:hypothetical protein